MATTYLSRTNTSGTSTQKGTISVWIKSSEEPSGNNQTTLASWGDANNHGALLWNGSDKIDAFDYQSGYASQLQTNAVLRDPSSWYHVVYSWDTTLSTADDRQKIYINGVEQTYSTRTNYSQNAATSWNANSYSVRVGALNSSSYFSGLMSQVILVDGTAYAASTFGSTNTVSGEWTPNPSPSVTYGTNGFKLTFEDTTALGDDTSGNTNDFTLSGSGTSTLDNPSNNFATLNPVAQYGSNQGTLSNGNTSWLWSNYQINTRSTLGMPKGKFYWEIKCNGDEGGNRIGMCTSAFSSFIDTDSADAHYNAIGNGGVYLFNTAASSSWLRINNDTSKNSDTYTNAVGLVTNDIIMNAVDVDAGKYWVGINGTWFYSGNPATGANAQITFTNSGGDDLQVFLNSGTNNSRNLSVNFGNGYFGTTAVATNSGNGYAGAEGSSIFNYQPPTGYSALSTKGLNL